MKTPIYDFVKGYAEKNPVRFHMPGHKGKSFLGTEPYDITEISGADTLYSADGIIAESEDNLSSIFKTAHSFYSTEGSTLVIKAMLALATVGKKNPVILAGRGAHKSLIYAAALLDVDIVWMFPEGSEHLCSAALTKSEVERALSENKDVSAVFITSPDYLGNLSDVLGIAEACKKYSVPLLVDNAHGAYLNFLSPSRHPIALGADMCCDSAHKTLPCLTGGAYLHISKSAPKKYLESARRMLSLFASTSPSYLILESLDLCNAYLSDGYEKKLSDAVCKINTLKSELSAAGFSVLDTEPLKIVIDANEYGYTGFEIADCLSSCGVEAEFFDSEYLVLMATPENDASDYERLYKALTSLPSKEPIIKKKVNIRIDAPKIMSIRDAIFSEHEILPVRLAMGRICASPTVSCPPAVPIAVSGELITEDAVSLFERYKINEIEVVKND